MENSKNEVLNKATDENVVAGVLDTAKLSDDAIAEVTGGRHRQHAGAHSQRTGAHSQHTGDDTGCSH